MKRDPASTAPRTPHPLTKNRVAAFQRLVLEWYRRHSKHYPWRETGDPYAILVSEYMLQQTQADRVAEKFREFMTAFPALADLAGADTVSLIARWKGLGYNRRALYLQRAAAEIITSHGGKVPQDPEVLITLPGIGRYTSRSIPVFAFNRPEVLIETNIRTVYIHHFFQDGDSVSDAEIEPLVARTIWTKDPHTWYSALMDYGSHLKKTIKDITARSSAYKKQSPFKGSDRQIRGRILAMILDHGACTFADLTAGTGTDPERLKRIIDGMEREGFLTRTGKRYAL
ncbi:A/G-specific adenine glycosylase [bacterium]|nr:A/G-specific adenine glycosylase [bacterium]